MLSGKVYNINLSKSLKKVAIAENSIIVPKKEEDDEVKFLKKIKKWYKNLSEIVLKERISVLSSSTKLGFNTLKIGDFKGKWGSCDTNKNIKLQIIQIRNI